MTQDEHIWLEDLGGEDVAAWVRRENARTSGVLETDPAFEEIRTRILGKLTSGGQVPYGRYVNGYIYNFWQDSQNPRGIWRRSKFADYLADRCDWESLLNFDALSAVDRRKWVFRGANHLGDGKARALISLSDGGRDAISIREFDVAARHFPEGGFVLSEGKLSAAWVDDDRLLVGSSCDPRGGSTAGYARTIRLLKRGEALEDAPVLFQGERSDMAVLVGAFSAAGERFLFVKRRLDFFQSEHYWVQDDGRLIALPVPTSATLAGVCTGQALLRVKEPWLFRAEEFAAGSVVSLDLRRLKSSAEVEIHHVLTPNSNSSVKSVVCGRESVFVVLSEDVKSRVVQASFTGETWQTSLVPFPDYGTVDVQSVNGDSEVALFSFASFLVPDTLYAYDSREGIRAIRSSRARFDASGLRVLQQFARSTDGTAVPYFLVEEATAQRNSMTPVLLFGYGGFEQSLTPQYLPPMVQEWLAMGGAYAVANIRGGGEYGPQWHRSALRENRVRAFDDFVAVAEHLIASGVTCAGRLGIKGGSNGGLLAGAMLTRRPDLFSAIICRVPLLDMLRYHKLQAGASWVAEYGNPDDDNDRSYLETFSPYQNLKRGMDYPTVFFVTATGDDRVHPGHARKMHARMRAMGYDSLYFESSEGGHRAAATFEQMAGNAAMELVYLRQRLADRGGGQCVIERKGGQPDSRHWRTIR